MVVLVANCLELANWLVNLVLGIPGSILDLSFCSFHVSSNCGEDLTQTRSSKVPFSPCLVVRSDLIERGLWVKLIGTS